RALFETHGTVSLRLLPAQAPCFQRVRSPEVRFWEVGGTALRLHYGHSNKGRYCLTTWSCELVFRRRAPMYQNVMWVAVRFVLVRHWVIRRLESFQPAQQDHFPLP